MRKILLATAPSAVDRGGVTAYPPIYPPLGILYLAALIRARLPDWEVRVIDGQKSGLKRFLSEARSFSPDAIGLSFQSLFSGDAFAVSRMLKDDLPGAVLIAGGTHPSYLPRETLSKGEFDYAVMGEAEQTFPALLAEISKPVPRLGGIDGLAWKDGKGAVRINRPREFIKNLDLLPFPARDLMDIRSYPGYYYALRKPETSIMSSRGCPYKCTFCSKTWDSGNPVYRPRSAGNVADEIEILAKEYKIREIYDWCDEFNLVPKKAVEMLREIRSRNLDVALKSQFRADLMTEELAREMKAAGFWLANVGMESGNPATLRGIRKQVTVRQIISACRKLKRNGVKVLGFFMGFNVWEERGRLRYEGVAESHSTLRFIGKLLDEKLIDYFTFSIPTPYPASELYLIAKRHCLHLYSDDDYRRSTSHEPVLRLPGITEAEILRVKKEAMSLQGRALLSGGNFNPGMAAFYARKAAEAAGIFVKGALARSPGRK